MHPTATTANIAKTNPLRFIAPVYAESREKVAFKSRPARYSQRMRRSLVFVPLLMLSATSMAQLDMSGPRQYPQFRNMSGLPGSIIPVNLYGDPDYRGTVSLSTPIAYTLSNWNFSVALGSMSFDMSPRLPAGRDGQGTTNATVSLQGGIPLGQYGALTFGYMVLSNLGDGAFNFQFSPGRQTDPKFRFAVGVQDLKGGGGSAGELDKTDGDSSTSFYGVGTYAINETTHVSLGAGGRRFSKAFGNISTNLTPSIKATLEYDAFNWNIGLACRLGSISKLNRETYDQKARYSEAHGFVGVIRGKYLFLGLGVSF